MRGDRLRRIRTDLGFTQEELAQRLDMGVRQIWRYENNENTPSSDVLGRIARVLGTSSDYLLGLVDEPSPQTLPSELTTRERAALSAWRRGDKLEAVRVIITEE